MKKISVLLVCFMMLFAFVSCDNGGLSPAETVKTTASAEDVTLVKQVTFRLISGYYEQFKAGGPIHIDGPINQDGITGTVVANGSSENWVGSVDINADLEYQGRVITLDGIISWNSNNQDKPIDFSQFYGTIDGDTISGNDLAISSELL